MANVNFTQANFSLGELDPRMFARVDYAGYVKGAKQIRNCQVLPQGGVQSRWGTYYVASQGALSATNLEVNTYINSDGSTYLMVWTASTLKIYLENVLVATASTTYTAEDIAYLRFSEAQDRVVITSGRLAQQELIRGNNAANVITGVDTTGNTLTITNALTVGTVYPATFTTGGALPVTSPQIYVGRTYFVKPVTTTTVKVYPTSLDAINGTNAFSITGAGVGSLMVQNTWTLRNITFKFVPAYDFNGGYSAITFTPSAVSGTPGSPLTLTASAAIFDVLHNGGVFIGNGGVMRIVTATGATTAVGYTLEPFTDTSGILGSLAFLGEPVWSAARGYPICSTFFQNRLWFGGGPVPNGVWGSVAFDAYSFDDSETLDDSAISWYPASGDAGKILSLTSTRSLLAHTTTGNYSTPLTSETPVTPKTFNLIEQNKDGVANIQPISIDNQVIYVDFSGNNVKNMIWEITQSSYVLNNISVTSSSLVRTPVDYAAFADQQFTDGSFVFFVNSDGTLCCFQTLNEQDVSAWSLCNISNTFQAANIKKVATALDRCWFIVEMFIVAAQTPTAITAFSAPSTLTAAGHGLSTTAGTMVQLTTAGSLPATSPQVVTGQYYWAKGVDANTFQLYGSQADANAGTNAYVVSSAGTSSSVVRYIPTSGLHLVELDFSVRTDASFVFPSVGSATITGLSALEGETVSIVGDGFVFPQQQVVGGQVTLSQSVTTAIVGLPFTSTLSPLPVNIPVISGNDLYRTHHIRNIYIQFYQTVGATIQGTDMITTPLVDNVLGQVPTPVDGVFSYALMEGWDGFDFDIQIQQSNPLPMTILGIGYVMEAF